MNTSRGIENQMGFQKAECSREREGGKDQEESTVVTYAKGLRLFNWVAYGWEGELDQSLFLQNKPHPKSVV